MRRTRIGAAGATTSTAEDYLRRIVELTESHRQRVSMGAIAAAAGVVPGTATTMMQALARSGWVDYRPHRHVALTPEGRKVGSNVLRKHRLVATLLVKLLEIDRVAVGAEADRWEHAFSDAVATRLDAALRYPATDPNGHPIPIFTGGSALGRRRRKNHS
ncbi:MAG TPA: metal-dependent transcriptional regulator [Opitutaceae bacterium]|nr:metal-dependent transcriptional regulator [Opitutaceae bacterium]